MKQTYDNIAFIYDRLARLVYGRALLKAQRFLVQAIPPGSNVLIVGGGTGWILEEIAKLHPSGLSITYIDSSEKMIALSRSRDAGANKVCFIAAPVETIAADARYDVVLTPFLFDNFREELMRHIFSTLHALLQPGGLWLYCDFKDNGKLWQRVMLRIMYTFFRLFCGIEARTLPDVESCFALYRYNIQAQTTLLNGFIVAMVYKRSDH